MQMDNNILAAPKTIGIGSKNDPTPCTKVIPSGKVNLGDSDSETVKQSEWENVKTRLSGFSRKEKRQLRWQALKEIRSQSLQNQSSDGSASDVEKSQELVNHKETQTDAFVVMDSSVLDNFSDDDDLESFVLTKYFSQIYCSNDEESKTESIFSPSPVPPSSSSSLSSVFLVETVSTSTLAPSSQCLQGICPLLTGLLKAYEDDPVWLGCKYKDPQSGKACGYWVHAKCHGFPRLTKEVLKLTKGFRCPIHLE